MFSWLAETILRKRFTGAPTIDESINEAVSNYLGKASKIETAVDGIFAADVKELAAADRQRVAEYAAATVPGVTNGRKRKGSKMGGDFIVCDDYRKGAGTVAAVITGVVSTVALGIGGLGLWAMIHDETPGEPAAAVDTDTQYLLELVSEE